VLQARKAWQNYAFLVASTTWVIFTVLVGRDFVILFGGDDTKMFGQDLPPQYLWDLSTYPNKPVLWLLPLDYRSFFLVFFVIVILLLISYEFLGIITFIYSKKNFKERTKN
ncbi:MAG: hypothetical protein ACTSWN_10315, partial [Promethearchaeota archaeon]